MQYSQGNQSQNLQNSQISSKFQQKKQTQPQNLLQKPKISYLTYNKLVGESDGGKQLSQKEFDQLLQKYHDSWENRLYVHFARKDILKECIRVKPPCFCFCGHTFKSHEWYDTQNKKVKCRTPNCKCEAFKYLHRQGSWTLTCKCKHSAFDHEKSEIPGKCKNCKCIQFETTFSCQCGGKWEEHDTIVDTEEERKQTGKPVDTQVVKQRLQQKKQEGCGKCMGCKNRMPCAQKK
ncbi:hypothetical protein PPERSA_12697 [Pseudocohnilembus persalinus]|uniref:Protein FAM221A n=1 Tax=Pseudocohnilembus persalinus TaxID=266149 RepID=A0A0V0QT66_PSEPJ|nr:hypothetical protein PPERSA_12697 [Pseudocohnilembus persalinus]|eukprot:KRX05519.1 hypothetical protein PPERSA_12697 [Pseudocohnilembus persalinus]